MLLSAFQQSKISRYSRWVLVLFVLSWLNLSMQIPAHAAMMQHQSMAQTMGNSVMHMSCQCRPALCDSVLSVDTQSMDGIYNNNDNMFGFQVIFSHIVSDESTPLRAQFHFAQINWRFRQIGPPPFLFDTGLLI